MSVLFVKLHTKRHLETDETALRNPRTGISRLTKRHFGTDETADSEDEAEGCVQLGGEHVEQ